MISQCCDTYGDCLLTSDWRWYIVRLSRRSVKGSACWLVKEMVQRRLTINNAPGAVKSTSIPWIKRTGILVAAPRIDNGPQTRTSRQDDRITMIANSGMHRTHARAA